MRIMLIVCVLLGLAACSPGENTNSEQTDSAGTDTAELAADDASEEARDIESDVDDTATSEEGEAEPLDPEIEAEINAAFATYITWREALLRSDEVQRVEWQEQMRQRWQAAQAEPEGFTRELLKRVTYDQFPRFAAFWNDEGLEALIADMALELDEPVMRGLRGKLFEDWSTTDRENIAWLKAEYETHGRWFTISEFGEDVSNAAWLIVQHAVEDQPFMNKVLGEMETLYPEGEVSGSAYALLYDRVEMFHGRPQRYGSQFTCQDGTYQAHELEDLEQIDTLRAEVGLGSFSDYAKNFDGQTC